MLNLIIKSLLLLGLAGTARIHGAPSSAGGEEAPAGQYPFQVHLYVNSSRLGLDQWWCGGVIIDPKHILTAAHCIYLAHSGDHLLRADELSAFVGSHSYSGGTKYAIESLTYNAEFNPDDHWRNDIALLRTNRPIQFQATGGDGSVNSVVMPANNQVQYNEGDWFTVTGWGDIRSGGPPSTVLKQVLVPYYDDNQCAKNYGVYKHEQICAGGIKGQSPCQGDSGGPMVRQLDGRYELVGLVSLVTCGEGPMDTFTRVEHFLDWIEQSKSSL